MYTQFYVRTHCQRTEIYYDDTDDAIPSVHFSHSRKRPEEDR